MKIVLWIVGIAMVAGAALAYFAPDPDEGKYEQTWKRDYFATSCKQWVDEMTPRQRFVGAADVLVSQQQKSGGGQSAPPPDSLVNQMKSDISARCASRSTSVSFALAGIGAYRADPGTYLP